MLSCAVRCLMLLHVDLRLGYILSVFVNALYTEGLPSCEEFNILAKNKNLISIYVRKYSLR